MKFLGIEITRSEIPRPAARRTVRLNRRSYDAAATTRHNENHWLYADSRDADSIISQDLPTLRNRCRYECRNNTYAAGIADTLANDIVGIGPSPQLETENAKFNEEAEGKFGDWILDCDSEGKKTLAELIRLCGGLQQCESGEALIAFKNITNKKLFAREVELKLLAIEPDRLMTPWSLIGASLIDDKRKDGIEFDEDGRPEFYYISKSHPGAMKAIGDITDFDKIPAEQIIHLYRTNRPGQSRGVPWFTPALPLFAQLRRFTLATIAAAEQAANMSGLLRTETDKDDEDVYIAGEEIEIPRNSLLTVSKESGIDQLKPEQPSSTYEMFKNQIINEIARCINMPFNVAAANSADYNYASGRLDWQVYYRFVGVIRYWIEHAMLNRIFRMWLREASLINGYFKNPVPAGRITPKWHWPGSEHVDPLKEANAQETRLGDLTTNYAAEYAKQGKDYEKEFRQIAKEKALMKELGLKARDVTKNQNNDKDDDDEQESKKRKTDNKKR